MRKGLDPSAIKRARERLDGLRASLRAVEFEQQRLVGDQQQLSNKARTLSGDALAQALIESHGFAAQIADCTRTLDGLRAQRLETQQEYEEAKNNDVPLPPELSDEEHERLLTEALGEDEECPEDLTGPLADDLSADDLASLYGKRPQTINRWCREGFPRGRRLWDPAGWISTGPRSKKLRVDAINQELLTEPQRMRLAELRRRRAQL